MPHKNPVVRKHYMVGYRNRLAQRTKEKVRGVSRSKELYVLKGGIIRAAKNRPCADCGNLYHFCVMDFDHVRGEKLFNIAATKLCDIRRKLYEEIAKCDVVCANCHRVRTYLRAQGVDLDVQV